MTEWIRPEVSPPDAEGFRTFSFFAPGVGETIRISFNPERQREYLIRTSHDVDLYSTTEIKRLRLAARLVAAKDAFPEYDQNGALDAILNITPMFIVETLERHFPSFALVAIRATHDVCVKYTLNQTVKSMGAPGMYDETMLKEILRVFVGVATEFLDIKPGRPRETEKHLLEVSEALDRLEKSGRIQTDEIPSQELVAERIGVTARVLRDWCRACGLKWHEFLRACGWPREPEGN